MFFARRIRTRDRGAPFALAGDHPGAFAVRQPADGLKFGKRLPHADQPGTAAGRVQDDVRQFPVELFRQLEPHGFFALNAVRLLEGGEVKPTHQLAPLAHKSAAIVNQPIHPHHGRPGEVRLLHVDHRGVVRHEHERLHPGTRRIGGHGAPGVAGSGTGNAPDAKLVGHRDRQCHAARLEAPGGQPALVLEKQIALAKLGAEPGRRKNRRHRLAQ